MRLIMTLSCILFWVLVIAAALRLMAWADTGMRGDEPPVENINPFHAHE